VAQGSPIVRRRELGAFLRRLRDENGMSVKQVTERLMCSPSKVSRIETGQRSATPRDVRDLCDLYGVTDQAERDHLMNLAREAREHGWWQIYDLPEAYSTYIGLEAEALSIRDYDSAVVPGLLQIADYASALFEEPLPQQPPTAELTSGAIDQRLEVRLRRQDLLGAEGNLRSFWAILDEAVLHRVVGSKSVMRRQLDRIIEVSKTPKVTLQIVPYSAGAHPGLNSTFNILEFSGDVPDVVYVEGVIDRPYVERPDDLERYRQVFDRMCQIAMTPEQSVELISKVRESYGNGLRLRI
jgi:transcriptional regulator with XRE-family HTH domain